MCSVVCSARVEQLKLAVVAAEAARAVSYHIIQFVPHMFSADVEHLRGGEDETRHGQSAEQAFSALPTATGPSFPSQHPLLPRSRITLARIPIIRISRILQPRLSLRAPRHSIVWQPTQPLRALAPHTLPSGIGLERLTVSPDRAVASGRLAERVVAVRDGLRDPTGADVDGAGVSAVEVGGRRGVIGEREGGFALLDYVGFVLGGRVDDGLRWGVSGWD